MYTQLNRSIRLMSVAFAALIVVNPSCSWADDEAVQNGLQQAKALFEKRSASNPAPIDEAIQLLSNVEGKADDSDLNYQVFIAESKALYWKGQHSTNNDQRIETHQ